jgi:hypothetical protein
LLLALRIKDRLKGLSRIQRPLNSQYRETANQHRIDDILMSFKILERCRQPESSQRGSVQVLHRSNRGGFYLGASDLFAGQSHNLELN